ncbi:DNA polymerase III gamma/tau subunit [Nocardioides nitrophenolicus]|nr:DNA polymerase III gamma/tau subunit [Nocardioides nitrophenolicus]
MSYYEEISCAQASNREALQEALRHRDLGTIANRRVYLLDEAHALDYNAQSWLLGPLEDRDSKPLFILCTTEPEKLQSAVRDRCIDVAFGAVADQDLAGLLLSVAAKEGIQLGVPDAVGLAQQAGGSPRNALSLLDGSAHGLTTEHRSTAERIVAAMAAHNVGTMLVEVREAVASGEFRAAAVRGLAVEYWLDLLAHKRGAADSYRTSPRLRQHFEVARAIPEEVIASRLKVLADLDLAGQAGLRAELALEAALVQCISATDLDRHLAVMRRLDRLQSVVSRLVENPEGGAA